MSDAKSNKRFKKIDRDSFSVAGKTFRVDQLPAEAAVEIEEKLGGFEEYSKDFSISKALNFIRLVIPQLDKELTPEWIGKNIVAQDVVSVAEALMGFFFPVSDQEAAQEQD